MFLKLIKNEDGATAFVQMLGHKADLMVILFRRSFDDLAAAQLAFSRTPLHACLRPATSYVSTNKVVPTPREP